MSTGRPGMFQCGLCKRDYKRLDHLSRHVRSHTQSKPHKCHICGKSFTRTDLLKRHVAGHDSQAAKLGSGSFGESGQTPGRVGQACKACASNHLRCTEDKPCRRCVDKGIECLWDTSMDVDPAFTPPETECPQEETFLCQSRSGSRGLPSPIDPGSLAQSAASSGLSHQPDIIPGPESAHAQLAVDPSLASDGDPFSSGFPALNLLSAQWPSSEGLGLSTNASNDLDDMDLRFLDNYNTSVPFEVDDLAGLYPSEPVTHNSSDPGQPAAMCAEAFRNSHWHFRPNAREHHARADEHNLSLPPASEYPSPESRVSLDSRVTCAKLDTSTRDKILTTVVKSCHPENLPRAVASFPSVELLDTLLQYYLTSPVTKAATFLHTATFDPNERKPELLAAMAASGAILTSDSALSKLGYAIIESVRFNVAKLWDNDNSLIRDLQLSQAYCIVLEVGVWSGHSRRVEIAESFLHPLLTMLRRGGKLGRAAYPETNIDSLHGDCLRRKWLEWVDNESFKRLVFRLLLHDTHSSMALLVDPLISYAEVQLPLPDSAALWSSTTPEQWRFLFSTQANHQSLAVADLVDDPELLNTPHDSIDTAISSFAVLSVAWGLTWEWCRFTSFQRLRPRRWNALLTTTRLEELLKLLSHLRISMSPQMRASPELTMRFDLVLVHLHMPFEDIQIFAGMEGPEQARAVYPIIRDWVNSEAARKAIFHAGQIIRSAKMLAKGSIRGPEVIILYHASLAFWVYGLLSGKQLAGGDYGDCNAATVPSAQDVLLDDVDSPGLQRFTGFGRGRPCIQWRLHAGGDTLANVSLEQPDVVMEAVVGVVQTNFEGMAMPHLTEKLIQLMGELKKSSRRTMGF